MGLVVIRCMRRCYTDHFIDFRGFNKTADVDVIQGEDLNNN